jgi:CxxC motif-containing protein (DUF1111 family)
LLGDGYVEAIADHDLEQNAARQRRTETGIKGKVMRMPVLEAATGKSSLKVARFGWKSQHSSLMSSCADSLRNELGIRNLLYPEEYSTHTPTDPPTPLDQPDPHTGKAELESLLAEIRHTPPPARDDQLDASPEVQAGEQLFNRRSCDTLVKRRGFVSIMRICPPPQTKASRFS